MATPPTRGYLLTMPILIVNLGMEMLYVLEQRLRAQAIPNEKGRRGACGAPARAGGPCPCVLLTHPPAHTRAAQC